MTILITILVTLLVVSLLFAAFFKIAKEYARKIFKEAANISCYINTYRPYKSEKERVELGQKKFYAEVCGAKIKPFRKDLSDEIFWKLYTQYFDNMLNCLPREMVCYNNRCLKEGEKNDLESYFEIYMINQKEKYEKYASVFEKVDNKEEINNVN